MIYDGNQLKSVNIRSNVKSTEHYVVLWTKTINYDCI